MTWNLTSDGLPPEKQEVLLHWPVPGMRGIYRIGSLFYMAWMAEREVPVWKFELDCGDASTTIFSCREDEQPTHWAEILSPAAPLPDASAATSVPNNSASSAAEGAAGMDAKK